MVAHRALASAVLLAALLSVPAAARAQPQEAASTTVSIDTRAGLAAVPTTALGVNHAIWDTELGTPAVADLLAEAGVGMVRYPGGSYADIYHWETHTAPGGYVAPNTDFDTFMAGARRTGAEPMIIANYGTGSADEAAAWVRYANVTRGYAAKWWTIGNENYGNGHYGTAWEADDHADLSPARYAAEVVEYSQKMKAVDPGIKVGAVLTIPGNWPDGIVAEGDAGTWNQEVLTRAGAAIDFVDIHWYPGGTTEAEALSRTAHIQDAIFLLRDQIKRYAGERAGRIGISLTETNVGVGPNTQPGALFLADAYSGLLEQGVFTVQWWNVHNGIGTVSTVAGHTDYGDYGLLSSGNCTADASVCEPTLNTPFAPYHALSLLGEFIDPADLMVRAESADPLVSAHAARRPDGSLAVLLINKDPSAEHAVTLAYQGWTPAPAASSAVAYTNGASGLSRSAGGSATSRTLPAYSIMMLVLQPAGGAVPGPAAPATPAVSGVTDRAATITWNPVAGAAKYEILSQGGGLLGETTGTSLTVGNLAPGTRYTINVLARNAAGALSWPSPPVTFVTGTPATSTCAVTFRTTTDWGNGYVATVDVTNTGTAALHGWTLAFAWPTAWQQLSSGWSATWYQDGRTVRATSDAELAPGATANLGFVGSYSGPNVPPAVFTLNGTVCAQSPASTSRV